MYTLQTVKIINGLAIQYKLQYVVSMTAIKSNQLSCPISHIRCTKKVWKPKMI